MPTYVRHRLNPDSPPRSFGPMAGDHPIVGAPCPACDEPIVEGDMTTLVPLGPGDSDEARQKARTGRPYNAVAIVVHYACATGFEVEFRDT